MRQHAVFHPMELPHASVWRFSGRVRVLRENLKAAINADPQAPTKIPLKPPSVSITIFQRTPPASQR
jgi:hypothetical protein